MNTSEQKMTAERQGEAPKTNLPPDQRRCTATGPNGQRCKAWVSERVRRESGAHLCTGHARSVGLLDAPIHAPLDAPQHAPGGASGMPPGAGRPGDDLAAGEGLGRASELLLESWPAIVEATRRVLASRDTSGAELSRVVTTLHELVAQEQTARGMRSKLGGRLESMSLAELDAELASLEGPFHCPHCGELIDE